MGWPEVAENGRKSGKIPMTHGGRRRLFAGPILVSPAAARLEIAPAWSSGGGAPPRQVSVHCGWPESPPLVQNPTARKWFKITQLGSTSFGELL